MPIEQRTVIVTGAASGIGLATAERLARAGAYVMAVDLDDKGLRTEGERIRAPGIEIEGRQVDVRDLPAFAALVDDVIRRWGRIDALVGCAGLVDASSVDSGNPQRWSDVLTVNALGPMVGARAVLPHMLEQGTGDIVVVTSASGRVTYVGEPAYVASKHAAVAFLDSLRKELAGTDIRVTSIEPGLVDTPMSRSNPFVDTILGSVQPLEADDIANLIELCLSLPTRMNINEIVVRPTRQEL